MNNVQYSFTNDDLHEKKFYRNKRPFFYLMKTNILVPTFPKRFHENCWSIQISREYCIVKYLDENNDISEFKIKLGSVLSYNIKIELFAKGIDNIQQKFQNELTIQRHNCNPEYFVIVFNKKIVYQNHISKLFN